MQQLADCYSKGLILELLKCKGGNHSLSSSQMQVQLRESAFGSEVPIVSKFLFHVVSNCH